MSNGFRHFVNAPKPAQLRKTSIFLQCIQQEKENREGIRMSIIRVPPLPLRGAMCVCVLLWKIPPYYLQSEPTEHTTRV